MATAPKRGLELKLEIIRMGLTVTEVARRIGVSRYHLGRLLGGRVEMTDKLARDLAMALRIPKERIWQLWRGEEE